MSLLTFDSVSHWYRDQSNPAVAGVDLAIEPGQLVAVVGESGCGKSTLGRLAAGIMAPTEGTISFKDEPVAQLSRKQIKIFRRQVQMVHQDPFASLNPNLPLRTTLGYGVRYHRLVAKRDLDHYLADLLRQVDLDPTPGFLDRYPHQLSGGQRQRIAIARAISMRPLLVVADEAVSMLDVSMRVALLDLMLRFREDQNVGYLFVSHDLGVVRYFAGEGHMIVMFYGTVVEEGDTEDVITAPRHPYTAQLLAGVPIPDPRHARQRDRSDLLRSVSAKPAEGGCVFRHRCPLAQERCAVEQPPLTSVDGSHRSACWYADEVPERAAASLARPVAV